MVGGTAGVAGRVYEQRQGLPPEDLARALVYARDTGPKARVRAGSVRGAHRSPRVLARRGRGAGALVFARALSRRDGGRGRYIAVAQSRRGRGAGGDAGPAAMVGRRSVTEAMQRVIEALPHGCAAQAEVELVLRETETVEVKSRSSARSATSPPSANAGARGLRLTLARGSCRSRARRVGAAGALWVGFRRGMLGLEGACGSAIALERREQRR